MSDLPPDAVEAAAQAFSVVRGTIDERATAALLAAQPAWEAWPRETLAVEFDKRAAHVGHGTERLDGFAQGLESAARICREGGTP